MSSTHYESLGYDAVSRLTSQGLDLAGASDDLTLGFAHNPASQIASTTRSNDGYAWSGAATGAKSYTSNGLNQYGTAGGSSLSYDTKGNTTAIGSNAYTYSSENLLLTGPNSASLTYDPLLRLYQVGASGFTTSRFAYDGQAMIGEYDTSGTLLKRYVHGPGTDEPLVEYDGSGTKTYLAADERGSVVSRSNVTSTSVAKNSYDEYGNPGSGNVGRYGYTGQTWLFQFGMSYYKARMYAPAHGRFMQTDPIGYGDGSNWYSYVGADPINATDYDGLATTTPCTGTPAEIVICGVGNLGGDPGPYLPNTFADNCELRSGCKSYSPDQFFGNRSISILPQIQDGDIVITAHQSKPTSPSAPKSPSQGISSPPCEYSNERGCVYVSDGHGGLKYSPEYQKHACENYKRLVRSSKIVAGISGATNIPGAINVATGGGIGWLAKTSKFLSSPGFIFMRGVTYGVLAITVNVASPPPGCN